MTKPWILLFSVLLLTACPGDDWLEDAREQMFGEATEVDLNGNGWPEVHVLSRAADGSPRDLTIDYDEDGTVDAYLSYTADGSTYEADLDHDGRPDHARRFRREADGTILDIIAFDSDHDGALDARQRITLSPATGTYTSVLEIEALGELWPVRTSSGPIGAATAQAGPTGSVAVSSCGAGTDAVAANYAKAVAMGRECLSRINNKLAVDFEVAASSRSGTSITCTALAPDISAQATTVWEPSKPMGIEVDPAKPDGTTVATMFHEIMHYVMGGHPIPHTQPGYSLDAIVGCEDYCFGSRSRSSCEQCVAATLPGGSDCDDEDDACSFDPNEKCIKCGGQELVVTSSDQLCATCNGKPTLMRRGETCCGDQVCPDGSLCGVCHGESFCSSFSQPRYCAECPEGPRVVSPGRGCCPPGQTYNRTFRLCEQKCPGGAAAGGDAPYAGLIELGTNIGTIELSWNAYTIPDNITVLHDNDVLFETGCSGGSGSVVLDYSGASTSVLVTVEPNCNGDTGTVWDFSISCPQ